MKLKLIDTMQEQARIFGKMNRCTQTIEECAELTKELCKYQRLTNKDKTCSSTMIQTLEHIAEEIADVEICTCQLKHLFDIKNKVDEIKEQKLLRTEQRLKEEPKIKVTSAEIVVSNNGDARQGKPYYNIKYKELGQEEYTIGYSSYKLQYVLEWLDTYFEIVEEQNIDNKESITLETEVESDVLRKIMFGETSEKDKQDCLLFNQRNHIV